jgi:hypothetical protein
MGQLVRYQPPACWCPWRVPAGSEKDIRAAGEGLRVEAAAQLRRLIPRVHPHGAELSPEGCFKFLPHGRRERPARSARRGHRSCPSLMSRGLLGTVRPPVPSSRAAVDAAVLRLAPARRRAVRHVLGDSIRFALLVIARRADD